MKKKPIRIQRKRTKGWKMPPNTVYVGRPSDWGNHWENVSLFEKYIRHSSISRKRAKKELKGKNLACWCPLDQPCHADILLKIANE